MINFIPKHVAVVMDGNRCWACQRGLPKAVGHVNGATHLQTLIGNVEAMTAHNEKITLTIAANYGGRWDILHAVQAWYTSNSDMPITALTETALQPYLNMAYTPEPDLLIRTGGESRISNFMLWQSAYTELYFTPVL